MGSPTRSSLPVGVWILGLTVFSLGTTEFMVAGLVPDLAADLGVSTAQAGLLVSIFALGVVVGAPLVSAATTRVSRKPVLLVLLAVFVAGEVLGAAAPTFEVLLVARVVTAVAHGAFFGIGAVLATSMVGPTEKARAVAVMFGGLTAATLAGVPLGTLVGQQLSWRASFLLVACLGVIDAIGVQLFVGDSPGQSRADLRHELASFASPAIWFALGTTALSQAGLYATFTYILPLLTDSGFSEGTAPLLLVIFGFGTLLGSAAGGRLADRNLLRTLRGGLWGLATVLALLTVAHHGRPAMIVAVLAFGFFAFVINPALQTRAMTRSRRAPTLSSTANIAAFNVGNAVGPWLGGLALDRSGALGPSWVGCGLVLCALLTVWRAHEVDVATTPDGVSAGRRT